MWNLHLILVFVTCCLQLSPCVGIKCFSCAKRVLNPDSGEEVPLEESDIDCDDFRKANEQEKKRKYSIDCTTACEQTVIKGYPFLFKETLFTMDIEHYRCYNPFPDDERTNIQLGICVNVHDNERTCICNDGDYCLVNDGVSLESASEEDDGDSSSEISFNTTRLFTFSGEEIKEELNQTSSEFYESSEEVESSNAGVQRVSSLIAINLAIILYLFK